jgi:hypothetical protein
MVGDEDAGGDEGDVLGERESETGGEEEDEEHPVPAAANPLLDDVDFGF